MIPPLDQQVTDAMASAMPIEPPTTWEKVKAWFRNSLTIFVARIGTAVSGILLAASQMADVFNMPGVKEQLASFLPPKTVAMIGIGAFVVVELSRRRTLPKA